MIKNTGYKGYDRLRQKNAETGEYTGVTKANDPNDPDYVQPVYDPKYCDPNELYLTLSQYESSGNSSAGSIVVNVESNTEWTVVLKAGWLSIDIQYEGIHDETIAIGYESNPGSQRVGSFEVRTTEGNIIREYTFTQEGEITTSPITLAKSSSGQSACDNFDYGFYTTKYIEEQDFFSAVNLFSTENGSTYATSGWYSDGNIHRYWDGTQFTSNTPCKPKYY
jgi:hypothetical protein